MTTSQRPTNIVLIGMPGVGKSTVGVLLAKVTSKSFVDTDLLIQSAEGRRLQDILDTDGLEAFRAIEERRVSAMDAHHTVIATGGSVPYSDRAMAALKSDGTVVFLDLPLGDLQRRITNMDSRGIVIAPGQTFAGLYEERMPVYRRHADVHIDCRGRNHEDTVRAILDATGVMAMAKSDPSAERIAELKALADEPRSAPGLEQIRKALSHRSNRVAAEAARTAAAWAAESLEDELNAAFRRFMSDPVKTDPGCGAKVAIIEALLSIRSMAFPIYLEGIHHVQKEPVFGGREDTAPRLRVTSARALAALGYPFVHGEIAALLTDEEIEARRGASVLLASIPGDSSELLLRMRVLAGDAEPDVIGDCFASLMALAPERSLSFVARYLDASLPEAQGAALALGESHLDEAFDALTNAWNGSIDAGRREAFALPIALLRTDAAMAFLVEVLRNDRVSTAVAALEALRLFASDDARRRLIVAAAAERREAELRRAMAAWDA